MEQKTCITKDNYPNLSYSFVKSTLCIFNNLLWQGFSANGWVWEAGDDVKSMSRFVVLATKTSFLASQSRTSMNYWSMNYILSSVCSLTYQLSTLRAYFVASLQECQSSSSTKIQQANRRLKPAHFPSVCCSDRRRFWNCVPDLVILHLWIIKRSWRLIETTHHLEDHSRGRTHRLLQFCT